MKKIAAMVLAGVLAAVPVSTTGAAEFQDGTDTQNFIWAAGKETSTDTDESKGVSANDSVVEGLDKPLVFYPNTYYKFNVTGAGTQNTNPVEGDVRWTPLYWSLSLKPQESDIHRKWEIGSAKGIYTKVERAYNIYVFFQREEYTGGIWEKNDIVQPVRYQFNAAPLTEQGGSYKYLIGGIGYKILNEREVSVTGLAAEYNVIQIPAINVQFFRSFDNFFQPALILLIPDQQIRMCFYLTSRRSFFNRSSYCRQPFFNNFCSLQIPKKEENSGKKADCYNNFQNDHHFIPFCSSLVYKWYRDLYLMDCVTSSHPSISRTSYTL